MNLKYSKVFCTSLDYLFRNKPILRAYKIIDMEDRMYKGDPMNLIVGTAPEFPRVSRKGNHSVLYSIPSVVGDRHPRPEPGQDMWDGDHVRMPCSKKSEIPVRNERGQEVLEERWKIIKDSLSKPIRSVHELCDTILSYNNGRRWEFPALYTLFNDSMDRDGRNEFFSKTIHGITKLALALPDLIQAPIPLLKKGMNHSVSLSQQQIASLLANAFFCTFPRRNAERRSSEFADYPFINFSKLYEQSGSDTIIEKLNCICHYFRRVVAKAPTGTVTFSRRSAKDCPNWMESRVLFQDLPVHVDPDLRIEDARGLIQIDFANKFLGGGVLGHGTVQEEIRFLICPELMVSMLFTEMLGDKDTLMIIGCERYSNYDGYGNSFRWAGNHDDNTPYDLSQRRKCAVLAIDAVPYRRTIDQFQKRMVDRELNKAWAGFSMYIDSNTGLKYPGVATGNWGCGAFGGSPQLKSLIQLMACAQTRRPMAFCTFGDTDLRDEVYNVSKMLKEFNCTVGQIYRYILDFCDMNVLPAHLPAFILQKLQDDRNARVPRPPPQGPYSPGSQSPAPQSRGSQSPGPYLRQDNYGGRVRGDGTGQGGQRRWETESARMTRETFQSRGASSDSTPGYPAIFQASSETPVINSGASAPKDLAQNLAPNVSVLIDLETSNFDPSYLAQIPVLSAPIDLLTSDSAPNDLAETPSLSTTSLIDCSPGYPAVFLASSDTSVIDSGTSDSAPNDLAQNLAPSCPAVTDSEISDFALVDSRIPVVSAPIDLLTSDFAPSELARIPVLSAPIELLTIDSAPNDSAQTPSSSDTAAIDSGTSDSTLTDLAQISALNAPHLINLGASYSLPSDLPQSPALSNLDIDSTPSDPATSDSAQTPASSGLIQIPAAGYPSLDPRRSRSHSPCRNPLEPGSSETACSVAESNEAGAKGRWTSH